jgi:signal transduction histidine kinase
MKRLLTLSAKREPIVGALVLAVAIVLLVLSNRTGKEQYDVANRELDRIEAVNARLDAAVLALRFHLHTDFDLVTELERDLRLASAALTLSAGAGSGVSMPLLVEQKVELLEEFKPQHAVVRNSIAISEEMMTELWANEARTPGSARTPETLLKVERALLHYVATGDSPSGRLLAAEIEAAEGVRPDLSAVEQWRLLAAHVDNLLQRRAGLEVLLNDLFAIAVPQAVEAEHAVADAAYASSAAVAARYRVALFVVAVLLLAFSAWKVAQVGGYVKLIESANETLEERVAERTKELSGANAALQKEILERAGVEAQLRLAQKLESIGQLSAGIAHEINTPVQYVSDNLSFMATSWQEIQPLIDDYSESLKGEALDSTLARRLEIWNRADMDFIRVELPVALEASSTGLKTISRIVRAMKEFSHPGSEGLQPADINRAIETTVTVAGNEWKYVAEVHMELGALPSVLCNVSSFNQVILNLIVNAAQAIGQHLKPGATGNIWIKTQRLPEQVEIRMEDDGPGVPEAIRNKIFDPFFTTKEVGKGTGQGLSIAYRVVCQQHGGTLTVEPRAGGGACFVIRLPVAAIGEEPTVSLPIVATVNDPAATQAA